MRFNHLQKVLLVATVCVAVSCSVIQQERHTYAKESFIKVDNAPFFPIAVYAWCPDILTDIGGLELDKLKSAGFNLIDVKFKDTTSNKYLDFLDRCKSRDISIIVEGNTEEATRGSNDPLFFKSVIDNYTAHPSLFGFSISDDANNGKYPLSNLSTLHTRIKQWDKNKHYTLCSTYPRYIRADPSGINPAALFGITDLLFFQTYPIGNWAQYSNPAQFTPSEELYQNEVECFTLQAQNVNNQPWVTTPQTFSWSFFHQNREERLPTTEELRNIIYVGLNNGAKGVIYYELHIPKDTITGRREVKLYQNDTLWKEIAVINKELDFMKNVFMLGKRTKLTTISWTSASYWTYQGATYVIVANLHKTDSQHVDYAIPGFGLATNLFAQRQATLAHANGRLTGKVPPKEVQIYKINIR
jgi:hypothetical protein